MIAEIKRLAVAWPIQLRHARVMNQSTQPNIFESLRNAPVPGLTKYAQLRRAILSGIENGHWRPGDQLPAERDIAEWTLLSVGTVQRALRTLAEEGFIVRSQGSGTFVTERRHGMESPWHCRFLNDNESGFLPVFPKLLLRKRITETGPWSTYLGTQSRPVIRLDRRLSINDEFYVYSKLFLSAERFGDILNIPAKEINTGNLKSLIARTFNVSITQLTQRISFASFPSDIARAINKPSSSNGILMTCLAMAGFRAVVYYQELYIPPNRRRLVVSDHDTFWLSESAGSGPTS